MKNTPLISIITPSFNSGKYIERAIQSVLCQEYDNWEHIIVDGGSTDGTLEILKKYSHLKWTSEPDKGIYDAMNKGIDMARGEWVYFMGADDELFGNNILSKIAPLLISSRSVLYGNVKFRISGAIYDGKFTSKKLAEKNICHQSIFYKKNLLVQLCGYEIRYKMLADWHLNMKWFNNKNFKKKYLDLVIAIYNEDGSCFNMEDHEFALDWDSNVKTYFPRFYHFKQKYNPEMILRTMMRHIKNYARKN
jgi:glycosyltransferase involved in cell wall biosynthesis